MSVSEEVLMPNPVSPTIDPLITGGSEAEMLGKDRWEQVRGLHEAGITVSETGRRLKLDRKTGRRRQPLWRGACSAVRSSYGFFTEPYSAVQPCAFASRRPWHSGVR